MCKHWLALIYIFLNTYTLEAVIYCNSICLSLFAVPSEVPVVKPRLRGLYSCSFVIYTVLISLVHNYNTEVLSCIETMTNCFKVG